MSQATKPKISACIIARDEALHLPDCLASVGFCDELIVVDSGSSDATVEIARSAGATVVEQPWLGFASQRNVAIDHAHGDWILEIDADERVSPQLRGEIEAFVAAPPPDVALAGLPLREVLLGHTLGPSAKYPKYRHRLLLRGAYRHEAQRTVHEGLIPHGAVHPFEGDLLHLLASSAREAVADTWRYARLEAGQLQAPLTPRSFLTGALLRPSVKLVYRLTVDGGWRDGWAGLLKIALDCATDTIVWTRHLFGRRGQERGRSGVGQDEHYASWKFRRGSLRVVAVACGPDQRARAEGWLEAIRAQGGDVALVSDLPAQTAAVRTRVLDRPRPFALIHALEAEEQLRPVDAVVAFGTRARRLLALTPPSLRGHLPQITQETDPHRVNWDRREQQPA